MNSEEIFLIDKLLNLIDLDSVSYKDSFVIGKILYRLEQKGIVFKNISDKIYDINSKLVAQHNLEIHQFRNQLEELYQNGLVSDDIRFLTR